MIRRDITGGPPVPEGEGWVVTLPTSAHSLLEEQWCEVDQVVAPDHPGIPTRVSITVTEICCCFSQAVKAPVDVMRWSSVPQATHSSFRRSLFLADL